MEHHTFSLYRIIIFGNQLSLLKSFYIDNFNFKLTEEIKDQWIILNSGSIELAFHKIGPGYEPEDGKTFRVETNTKLVFQINGDLKSFRQKLINKGIVIGDLKSFEGINSIFCDGEDPEGNIFQIEQKI